MSRRHRLYWYACLSLVSVPLVGCSSHPEPTDSRSVSGSPGVSQGAASAGGNGSSGHGSPVPSLGATAAANDPAATGAAASDPAATAAAAGAAPATDPASSHPASNASASNDAPAQGATGQLAWAPPGIRPSAVEPPPITMARPATIVPEKLPSMDNMPIHTVNKSVVKPSLSAAPPAQMPAVPAETIAKQNDYLQQWEVFRPTIANLSQEEQDQRRAALKRAVLGK